MREADRYQPEAAGSVRATGARPAPGLAPGRIIVYSWLTAAAAIGVLNQLHADLHEHHDLPSLVHWLRDGALAVPLAAVAVVAAALLVRSRLTGGDHGGSPLAAVTWAFVAAACFAILSIPGNQLHSLLYGAEEETVGWLQDALKDGAIAFSASLAVLLPAALLAGPPWRTAREAKDAAESPGLSPAGVAGFAAPRVITGSAHAGGDR